MRAAPISDLCTVPGVGLDLVDLTEFAQIMTKRPSVLERVFTPAELAYCQARAHPMQHLAARFAAKEAAFKAIGTGWAGGLTWHDAEVVPGATGAPVLRARGELARRSRALGARGFQISLSHSGNHAVAVVVLVAGEAHPRRCRAIRRFR
jgi:holo-[acyl-carrier protein] synthase